MISWPPEKVNFPHYLLVQVFGVISSGPLLLSVLQDPAVVIKEKGELLYEQRTGWEAVVLHEDRRSSKTNVVSAAI